MVRKTKAHPTTPRYLAGLGWIAWGALLASIATCAVGVQMDRQARRSLAVAKQVPMVFRGFALETLARDAYTNGDFPRGLALSRQLVGRRPIPADGLALYANGLLAQGQEEEALQPVLLAAQRGWHDRFTQRAVIVLASRAGDWPVAAQRVLALWRLGHNDDEVRDLTKLVLLNPKGVDSFSAGIAPGGRWWTTAFLAWAASELPEASIKQIAAAMTAKGADLECGTLSDTAARLLVLGRTGAATALWRETCGAKGMTRADDLALREPSGTPGPFDWRFPESPGLSTYPEVQGDHVVFRYANSAPIKSVMAIRSLTLSPGAWHIRLYADGAESRSLAIRVKCSGRGALPLAENTSKGNINTVLSVPESCPTQQIEILAGRGEGVLKGIAITR